MLIALLLLAQDVETTESFRSWKPQAGHKSTVKSEVVLTSYFKLSRGEAARPIRVEKAHTFEAAQEILDVEGRAATRIRRHLRKATYRKNIWEKPFDFQGAHVLYEGVPGETPKIRREDGKLVTYEDEAALRSAFMENYLDSGERENKGDTDLSPDAPLKLGETAELPIQAAKTLLGDIWHDIDPKSSSLKITFKGTATREGARYGTMAYDVLFLVVRYADLRLEAPIAGRLKLTTDVCVDGSRPDYTTHYLLEVKGGSSASIQGTISSLELDLRSEVKFSLRSHSDE
jgi:hypothetical protein